jgi:hypothetical protein
MAKIIKISDSTLFQQESPILHNLRKKDKIRAKKMITAYNLKLKIDQESSKK